MISQNIFRLINLGQAVSIVLIAIIALAGIVTSALAFAGILPWADIRLVYGGELVPWFGMACQLGVTALFILLSLFLPSARRVLSLETSHRRFEIDMDDITRAYRAAHWADRKEMFDMHREFDAVRERYQHLKSQPELAEMNSELLTIAAQMSEQTRDLADVYSDAKITQVRDALKQRKADAEALETRIHKAQADLRELKRLMGEVGTDEDKVASQLQMLRDEISKMGLQGTPHLKSVAAE